MRTSIFLLFFCCIVTFTTAHHSTNANFTQEIISLTKSTVTSKILLFFLCSLIIAELIPTKVVLDGDIHTETQTLAGLDSRDLAKRFYYCFLYFTHRYEDKHNS